MDNPTMLRSKHQAMPGGRHSRLARVRGRRFGLCIERANGAIDLGKLDEARAAATEARALFPDATELAELEDRLASQASPSAAFLTPDQPVFDSDPDWSRIITGMAVLVGLFSLLGFGLVRLLPTGREVFPAATVSSMNEAKEGDVGRTKGTVPTSSVERASVSSSVGARSDDQRPQAMSEMGTPASQSATPPRRARNDLSAKLRDDGRRKESSAAGKPRAPSRDPAPRVWRLASPQPVVTPAIARAPVLATPATVTASASTSPDTVVAAVAKVEPPLDASSVSRPASTTTSSAESRHAQSQRIRSLLLRYENAYNRLDAKAARAVWPGVDQAALGQAFSGLLFQRVSLGPCEITVIGNVGGASCAGKARWEPKIGGGLQSADRYWTFNLRKTGEEWQIDELRVR